MNADTFARIVASGFGAGYFPIAPGTAGSLVALAIGAVLLNTSMLLLVIACVIACAGGIWAVRRTRTQADPGWVVIDEFAGQWIAMLGMDELNWKNLLAAFILFRLFDIFKPRPVSWADERKDALGVMADDMIAGTMAALVLAIIFWQWPDLLD